MITLILFILALVIATVQRRTLENYLAWIIFFNIGVMGWLAFYSHTVMRNDTAEMIGWVPGNPFQLEIAVANLAFGTLGILSYWWRGSFWAATVIGTSIFYLGAFVVHMIQFHKGDTAPWNSGPFVWLNDLLLPILLLILLFHYLRNRSTNT